MIKRRAEEASGVQLDRGPTPSCSSQRSGRDRHIRIRVRSASGCRNDSTAARHGSFMFMTAEQSSSSTKRRNIKLRGSSTLSSRRCIRAVDFKRRRRRGLSSSGRRARYRSKVMRSTSSNHQIEEKCSGTATANRRTEEVHEQDTNYGESRILPSSTHSVSTSSCRESSRSRTASARSVDKSKIRDDSGLLGHPTPSSSSTSFIQHSSRRKGKSTTTTARLRMSLFGLLGWTTLSALPAFGVDEKMARWLEDMKDREKELKGDRASEIISFEEDDARKAAAAAEGNSGSGRRMIRGDEDSSVEDEKEEESIGGSEESGRSISGRQLGAKDKVFISQLVPQGRAPRQPEDLLADAARFREVEEKRLRRLRFVEKLSEKREKRTTSTSSNTKVDKEQLQVVTSSSSSVDDDKTKLSWGEEAVSKPLEFYEGSSQWQPGSLHRRAIAAQKRNLMHAGNPFYPKALTPKTREIIQPSTDYEELARTLAFAKGTKQPAVLGKATVVVPSDAHEDIDPLHPVLMKRHLVQERAEAKKNVAKKAKAIEKYVKETDPSLKDEYEAMHYTPFLSPNAPAPSAQIKTGARTLMSTSSSSDCDSAAATSSSAGTSSILGDPRHLPGRSRARRLRAATALRAGGLHAVEEDLEFLHGREKENMENMLVELEDIAQELEEEDVVRGLLNPLGPYDLVGAQGQNKLTWTENAGELANSGAPGYQQLQMSQAQSLLAGDMPLTAATADELANAEAAREEHKFEVLRDLRRAYRDQRAGQKVVDVVNRLRHSHKERRQRRRLVEVKADGELENNSAERASKKCGAPSSDTTDNHLRSLLEGSENVIEATNLLEDSARGEASENQRRLQSERDERRRRLLQESDSASKRDLTTAVTGSFFVVQPAAIAAFYDSRDEYCKKWTESPPIISRANAQFPRDGTGIMEQQNKACGVGIINYFFTTSDLDDYSAHPTLQQVVVISLQWATFEISETCENLLDAAGGLAIASCRFQANEAKFFLSQGLKRNTAYTLSVRHFNPETIVRANVANAPGLDSVANTLDSRGFVINTGTQSEILRIGEPNDPAAINVRQYERIDVRRGSMAGVNITNPDIATAVRGLVVPASLHFSHQYLAVENTFNLVLKFHQGATIEQPTQPQSLQFIKHNAKHPAADTENAQMNLNIVWEWTDVLVNLGSDGVPAGNRPNQNIRGYVNGFSWRPSAEYDSRQGTQGILFTFGFRFYGTLRAPQGRAVFLSQPSHIWELAALSNNGGATECVGVQYNPGVGLKCNVFKYPGYQGNKMANGIFFFYDSAGTVAIDTKISLRLDNPTQAVNMFWLCYSYQYMNGIMRAPFTMELDKPIATNGQGSGEIISTTSLAVNEKNKVVLVFKPGNTVIPMSATLLSGYLVIMPPAGYQVDRTAAPSSVAGFNALPCSEWPDADQQQNRWLCNVRDLGMFRDAQYAVQLGVINPAEPMVNTAWRVEVWQLDRSKPLATTREIKGISISGTMVASFEPFNQVLGNVNSITFKFRPSRDVTIAGNATFAITAPEGFKISKRCSGFQRGTLPADAVCKGTDDVYAELRFPGQSAIKANVLYEFMLDVINPETNLVNSPNVWRFDTVRPDGIVSDTTNYPGFFLYPSEFASFTVLPKSRLAGSTQLDVRFVSKVPISTSSYIRIMAPIGIKWRRVNSGFSTESAITGTNSMTTEGAVIGSSSALDTTLDNMLLLRLTQNLFAEFEYGIAHNILVPELTPIPNRYWIDTYVETGDPTAGDFEYIASLGAPGFRTRALFNAKVTPYNNVELAWNNPTSIEFETTTAVSSVLSDQGTVMVQSELFVEAPPGFTFICPTEGWNPPTQVIPDGYSRIPSDAECFINHQVAEERRIVHMHFRTQGLEMNTRYIFEVEIVNAGSVNPTTNKFILETRLDGQKIEGVTIDGYDLAKPMSNTRHAPAGFLETGEDRTVDSYSNHIAFIMGVTQPMGASSVLQVGGPAGFLFSPKCLGDVGWAQKFASAETLVFPEVMDCSSLAATTGEGNKVRITLKDPLLVGSYPFFLKVQNPNFAIPPEKNYWTLQLFEPGSNVATMAEAWVIGFDIQVVKEVEVYPYNPGNGIPGEAAPNPLDVRFKLTTRLPSLTEESKGALILVVPPVGFHFPSVCRNFMTAPGVSPYMELPSTTICNPSDLLKPELVKLYYRLGHPNFQAEFGASETTISDDIRWSVFYRDTQLMFRVRSVPFDGPGYHRLVRPGYELEAMVCYPEGVEPTPIQTNCLTEGRNLVALVRASCDTIEGQVALGTSQADVDAFLANFADPEVGLNVISDCISNVLKLQFDEPIVPVEMYLSGPALILQLGENTHLKPEQLYAFRVMVENPMETFDNVQDLSRWWTVETRKMPSPTTNKRSQIRDRLDLNYEVYSFAVYPRISLFQLQTLNYIGQSETDIKISFDITSELSPGQDITITAPDEFQFRMWTGADSLQMPWNPTMDPVTGLYIGLNPDGTAPRPCISPALTAAQYQVMDQLFPRSAIKDITRLPEYVSCHVISHNQIRIVNTEKLRGGRTLMAGPVYEFLVDEIQNPPRTPFTASNLWRIVANTTTPLGQEVWATEGWTIFPELVTTELMSSNPANGLFTTFTVRVAVLTQVPGQGSILLRAPRQDFYFGDRLAFDGPPPDLLNSIPRASGGSPPRPTLGSEESCTITAPEPQGNLQFLCPISITPCDEKERYESLDAGRAPKDMLYAQEIQALEFPCSQGRADCANRRYDKLFNCKYRTVLKEEFMSATELETNKALVTDWNKVNTKQLSWEPYEAQLEITLSDTITMKQDQLLIFHITGYNTLFRNHTQWQNEFIFATRNADSGKTTLDERKGVPGFKLFGVVYVTRIFAQETKVSNTYNRVTITFRLTNVVKQRGLIRIQYPQVFEPVQSAGGAGTNTIDISETVPRKAKKSQRGNIIELDSEDEDFPGGLDMQITITLSNPQISPPPSENIWIYETFHVSPQAPTGTTPPASALTMIDLNRDVQGFRIYGAFRSTRVASAIDSPTVVNTVAVSFVLESDLAFDESARLQVYMPKGFQPVELCGRWSRSYDPMKFAESTSSLDSALVYTEIPRGTSCRAIVDADEPAIELRPGAVIQFGLDYAFMFEIINADYVPDANNWRFQTMLNNVVLHLDRNVFGFSLQELQDITVQPMDTTRSVMGRMQIKMRSTKRIPGSSDIIITAPVGFRPLNTLFTILSIPGGHTLASTTTATRNDNVVTFTLDGQDRIEPNLEFGIEIWITNPEFTPADNVWRFEIRDAQKNFLDVKQSWEGYDITGAMFTEVRPGFATKSRMNKISVVFVPTTIMNQADFENVFYLEAPIGYKFPVVCSDLFHLKYSNPSELQTSSMGAQAMATKFPPENIRCEGSDAENVTITFPRGKGLLVFNYTLELEVENAAEDPISNIWIFETRKKASSTDPKYSIVDANRTIQGFLLQDMEKAPDEAGSAFRGTMLSPMMSVGLLVWGIFWLMSSDGMG